MPAFTRLSLPPGAFPRALTPCLLALCACTPAWYEDADRDGFGNAEVFVYADEAPEGFVSNYSDCDDTDASVNPDAPEICNGIDDDCVQGADEGAVDALTVSPDLDGDGYGDASQATQRCDVPPGSVANARDCDDTSAAIYPGAHGKEVPGDGVDVNCDGYDGCRDLSCDGWPDVVFSNCFAQPDGAQVSWVYFGGAAGYSASARRALPAGCAGINTQADLNGDGYLDLVFSVLADTVPEGESPNAVDSHIYWGGPGGLDPNVRTDLPTIGAWSNLVADLNADGHPDVFFAHAGDGQALYTSRLYWGGPVGPSPANHLELPTGLATGSAVGDLDGDGVTDLIVSAVDAVTLTGVGQIYWGSSAGVLPNERSELPLPGLANGVSAADLDQNGWVDLVFSLYETLPDGEGASDFLTHLRIFWNGPEGFSSDDILELPAVAGVRNTVADVDVNGWPDIVISSVNNLDGSAARVSQVYFGGAGGFSEEDRMELPTFSAMGNDVADLDGDGWPEVLFGNLSGETEGDQRSYIYWNAASGLSASRRTELPTVGATGVSARPTWP